MSALPKIDPSAYRRYSRFRRNLLHVAVITCVLPTLGGCEKDFDLVLDHSEPQLVVEAYINNEIPEYNYVMLSKSQTAADTDITSIPVKGAGVKITPGSLTDNDRIAWDRSATVVLKEVQLPDVPENISDGIYVDPNLQDNPTLALHGTPGKYYLLELEVNGQFYTATTAILYPIPISLSTGFHYTEAGGIEKGRITVHFKDPDTTGNCQLFYWRHNDNRESFGWGSLGTSKR
ncbi:MAG TPA: DUF4249 family protein, partial [Agriterribacter sp.]|nr:DUF4249 family protein [Agriterribacter sp.]